MRNVRMWHVYFYEIPKFQVKSMAWRIAQNKIAQKVLTLLCNFALPYKAKRLITFV